MAAFVFLCLFLVLMEVYRRELATCQKSVSMARCRPLRKRGDHG
ncbi:hypothetical protein Metal_1891 [Methylomicrobium album BG8]|uniref:Uncharacterized protein n=1 Tax=Methylomicrobium album BG8 TaxID=686340 RepID=H8GP71_METAL|nr:hypothetical protein [Methylomicrobium agile]EIC29657.1 hypothetical protein Metal_1891 [Methylomicrobium album BG8]